MTQPAFDFGDEALDDPANPTFTVSELADAVNGVLRRTFSDGIWVRGEIQGCSERGGHAYFTLADDTPGRQAVVRVQFFANARMRLRPLLQKHRLRLADGMKVRIFGHLDFYAPGGSARAEDVRPRSPLHARRPRPAARPGAAPPRRRRLAGRQRPAPPEPGAAAGRRRLERRDRGVARLPRRAGPQRLRLPARARRHPGAGPGGRATGRRAIVQLSFHATQRGLDVIVVIRGGGAAQRAGHVRRRADRPGHRRRAGPGADRARPRDRPQRRRRGRPHVAEDPDRVRRPPRRARRPVPAAVEQRYAAVLAAASAEIDRSEPGARSSGPTASPGAPTPPSSGPTSASAPGPGGCGRRPPGRSTTASAGWRRPPSGSAPASRRCWPPRTATSASLEAQVRVARPGQRAGPRLEHHPHRRRSARARPGRRRRRRPADHPARRPARCTAGSSPTGRTTP